MSGTPAKTPPAALSPGALFAGDLRIERFLGSGGMGAVFLARDLTLEREVALKVLLPGAAAGAGDGSADAARRRERRFLREARIMAGLDHPSILPVHRVGEDPATGLLYLTMKPCLLSAEEVRRLCNGPFDCPYPQSLPDWGTERRALSLADLLKGDKALPERAVAILARELVGAMGYAHRRRPPVIHRDVKPSNVLFDAAGRAYLTDFGIAKRLHGSDEEDVLVTVTADMEAGGPFVGTVPFAAPEQSRNGGLTPAADYYSLGVVLYRALTGTMPSGLKPPSEFDPGHVSRRWDELLKAMLEPDPARRLADPDAVTAALDAILSRRPVFRRAALLAAAGALALAAAAFFTRRPDDRAAAADSAAPPSAPVSEPPPSAPVPENATDDADFEPDADGAVWVRYGGRLRGTLRLEGRHLEWPGPLRLEGDRALEIVGPGRLDATFEGTPDALVVLRDCSVINATEDPDPARGPRFRLEAGSFLSFPNVLSIFPNHYAEPYAEPDPNHPSATDRAVRFRSRETTLDGQMTLERGVLHDAAARAKEDVAVPIPGFGESIGWSGVSWTTGSVHPWRPDADRPDRICAQIPGGVGEAWLRMEFEGSREFSFCYDKYFPGRNDHGGRGGEFELFCDGQAYHGDGRDGVPKDGERPFNIAVGAQGRHVFEFRFRSDLCAPPGHAFGVRLRLFPAGESSPVSITGGPGL